MTSPWVAYWSSWLASLEWNHCFLSQMEEY